MRGQLGTGHLHCLLLLLCPWVEGARVDGAGILVLARCCQLQSVQASCWSGGASPPPSFSASALLAELQQEPPAPSCPALRCRVGAARCVLQLLGTVTAVPGPSLRGSQFSVPGIGFTSAPCLRQRKPLTRAWRCKIL